MRRLRFAVTLGGDYRVELWQNPWTRVARELRLDVEALIARVGERTSGSRRVAYPAGDRR